MKWKKGACLLAVLLLCIPNISYAEEPEGYPDTGSQQEWDAEQEDGFDETEETAPDTNQDNEQNIEQGKETDNEQGTQQTGEDNTSQDAAKQEESEASEEDSGYVIWKQGRGITSSTLSSDKDRFSAISSGSSIISIETSLKGKLEAYIKENGLETARIAEQGQLADRKVAFYEYEKEMVVTSDKGTFRIQLPLLNTFISGGGLESLGAPTGEQTVENGRITQVFEKGKLSCEVENPPDTLTVRRGNTYYFKYSLGDGSADKVINYGRSGDAVLVGDWDGDGLDTLCVRRGNTYYFKNSISSGEADQVINYGRSSDEVLVGDWDGDGIDTLCVRRGNSYYFKNDITTGVADTEINYGRKSDIVLIGDWDGNGVDTLCVRRGNTYYIKNNITTGVADSEINYGRSGDEVLVGDWDGDGTDTLCVRRGNIYYIKNSIADGAADKTVYYGRKNDITYAGKWAARSKIQKSSSKNISFNQSHGFKYSQLTPAYAGNSINGASFRKSAITTHIGSDGSQIQYCAYYDPYGAIVLAKRVNEKEWQYQWTDFKGNFSDAHNVVSLAVDGAGYLHMAWSQHSGALMYAKSTDPGELTMSEMQMVGTLEDRVTYPEFYVQPSGDMFFLYRNGSSGNGNIVLNRYSVSSGSWQRVQDNLISGEGKISPYWQACVDSAGRLHISWVWRETGNVQTNYNMSYTVSADDSGSTFVNSFGEPEILPITESTSEVICEIPKNSSLINQTSMTTDDEGKPYIISYWRVNGVVQYNIIRYTGSQWIIYNTDIRNTNFDLSGVGTRQLPCARPQILVNGTGDNTGIYVLFRDDERGGKASVAKLTVNDSEIITEKMIDITGETLEEWEPNYDITLWNKSKKLNVFLQKEYFNSDGTDKSGSAEYAYVIDITAFLDE